MALEIWETLKESITAYTGLSPAAFFTVVALGVVTYYLVSSFFYSSPSDHAHHERSRDFEEMEPLPPPVQLGEITAQQLKEYDGSDPKKPLLMAIKAQIYDVTQSRVFYGPGGPYSLFAGKDASRALAKMSFEESDLTSDISGLGSFELDALQDWEYKFMSKYTKVGTVKSEVPVVTEGPTDDAAAEEEVPNLVPTESADEVNEAHVADNHVTKPVEAAEEAKPVEAAEVNEEGHVAKPVEAVEVKKEAHIADNHVAKPVEDSPSEASA